MIDLAAFKREAHKHGICDDYSVLWDACRSKKEMWDIASRTEAMCYLCRAASEGWGISAKWISEQFLSYCNGRYVYKGDYTSVIYVDYNGSVEVDTTAVCFLGCKCVVNVPPHHLCQIYMDADSDIEITKARNARVIVYMFGDGKLKTDDNDKNIKIKRNG